MRPWGINMLHEALIPHVWTMILLPVVLLSLLQGAFSKTVNMVLPHFKLELRYVCSDISTATETQASSIFGCAAKMIDTGHHGFTYNSFSGTCYLFAKTATGKSVCWTVVGQFE